MDDIHIASINTIHGALSAGDVLNQGTFQIASDWEGLFGRVLRFADVVPAGPSCVLVGQYVGSERNIVSALKKATGARFTPAVRGLFGKCLLHDFRNEATNNVLQDIDHGMLNAILGRQKHHLWTDQATLK